MQETKKYLQEQIEKVKVWKFFNFKKFKYPKKILIGLYLTLKL